MRVDEFRLSPRLLRRTINLTVSTVLKIGWFNEAVIKYMKLKDVWLNS